MQLNNINIYLKLGFIIPFLIIDHLEHIKFLTITGRGRVCTFLFMSLGIEVSCTTAIEDLIVVRQISCRGLSAFEQHLPHLKDLVSDLVSSSMHLLQM